MAERFHVNCALSTGMVSLHGAEAHHLGVVCRARPGDLICLFNGDGNDYPARVVEVARKEITIEVLAIEPVTREVPFLVHVATPLPRGDRAWFLVEKLTELGVGRLTLLSTARSVVQPREAKIEKLERQVIEASKQCGRNVLMPIDGPRPWSTFLREETLPASRFVAHPLGDPRRSAILPSGTAVVVAVGPEGGFTDQEIASAAQTGWQFLDLGPRILRIETVALALAARLTGQVGDARALP
jgi:16S rRNA (uracil1498-N3)-methyltransferase